MEALIIIDVQNGLVNRLFNRKDEFINCIKTAIIENRKLNNKIIFIQHNSKTLEKGSNNWKIYSELVIENNDIIIQKKHGDAFNNTNLRQYLIENKVNEIIVCGLTSQGCVFQTCKSGIENGFIVKLLKNGHNNWLKTTEEKINEVNNELKNIGIIII
jgi:nicotinamidase-related amidase